jgi:hypothetical protein
MGNDILYIDTTHLASLGPISPSPPWPLGNELLELHGLSPLPDGPPTRRWTRILSQTDLKCTEVDVSDTSPYRCIAAEAHSIVARLPPGLPREKQTALLGPDIAELIGQSCRQ